MKTLLRACLAVLVFAGPASAAATLITPALMVDTLDNYVRCIVTNISSKPITVQIESLNGVSGVVTDTVAITLNPMVTYSDTFGLTTVSICRFTVPSKSKVRAHACIQNYGTLVCTVQTDAQ